MAKLEIVNASRRTDGVFRVNFQLYRALHALGADVRWVECIDPSFDDGRFAGDVTLTGWKIPLTTVEQGVNRAWRFPALLRKYPSDVVLLGDPTLVRAVRANRSGRTFVRVHDLRPLTQYSDRASARWMFRYALPRLRGADRVIVHTETLRSQLANLPGLGSKVVVLPPHAEVGAGTGSAHLTLAQERRRRAERLSVLYIAADRPYKNIRFFLALAKALERDSDPGYDFTLVSRGGPALERELAAADRPNVTVVSYVSNVTDLYRNADVLAFPSLHEGFGLPLLEAMSYGMPVVANDLEPMREVVGNGGALLRPGDTEAWVRVLGSWTEESQYRAAAEAALDRAQVFSYERYVQRVPSVLELS